MLNLSPTSVVIQQPTLYLEELDLTMRDKQYPSVLTCKDYIFAVIYGMGTDAAETPTPETASAGFQYLDVKDAMVTSMKSVKEVPFDFSWVSTIFGARVGMPKSQEEFKMGMQSVAKRRRKQARQDTRYAPKQSMSAAKREWLRKKAASQGRSYGYSGK